MTGYTALQLPQPLARPSVQDLCQAISVQIGQTAEAGSFSQPYQRTTMAGFNWVLIVIVVVLALLSIGVALHLLVSYQHPEDKNQAWFPKLVVSCLLVTLTCFLLPLSQTGTFMAQVLTGITLAIWTVLLFPLDIANRNSCSPDLEASYCTFAIPSKILWYILYIVNACLVFGVIPFAIFYYEADSEVYVLTPLLSPRICLSLHTVPAEFITSSQHRQLQTCGAGQACHQRTFPHGMHTTRHSHSLWSQCSSCVQKADSQRC